MQQQREYVGIDLHRRRSVIVGMAEDGQVLGVDQVVNDPVELSMALVWLAGVRGLGEAGLRVPVGAKEPFPEAPMADLVLHIHRELIHHLSEVCLLRDLYLHTKPATNGATR
jgi:hypothetical protein